MTPYRVNWMEVAKRAEVAEAEAERLRKTVREWQAEASRRHEELRNREADFNAEIERLRKLLRHILDGERIDREMGYPLAGESAVYIALTHADEYFGRLGVVS